MKRLSRPSRLVAMWSRFCLVAFIIWVPYSAYQAYDNFVSEAMWKRVWLTYVFLQIDKSARFLDKPVHVEELNAYIAARQQEHQRLKAALGERIDYMSPYQIAAQLRAIAERAGLFPNEIDHLELPGSAHNLENISTTQAKYLLKEIAITLLLIPTIYLSVILLIWIVSGRNPYTTVTTRPTIIDVTPHEPFHSSHTKKRIDKE